MRLFFALFFSFLMTATLEGKSYSIPYHGWATTITNLAEDGDTVFIPFITLNSSGRAIAMWWKSVDDAIKIQYACSTDHGVAWSSPTDLTGEYNEWSTGVILNDSNQAIIIWMKLTSTSICVNYSIDGGAEWLGVTTLTTEADVNYAPYVALNSSGQAIAVWVRDNGDNSIIQTAYSIDGGKNWLNTGAEATNLSAAGENSSTPQIALNDSGQAVAVWVRNDIIQTAYSINGGKNWLNTEGNATNLSAAGGSAGNSAIALDASGWAIAIWDNTSKWIQTKNDYYGTGTISAEQKKVRFPLTIDLVNEIIWPNMTAANIYKIYLDAGLTQVLDSYTLSSLYSDHNRIRGLENYYYFTVTENDTESSSVKITLP